MPGGNAKTKQARRSKAQLQNSLPRRQSGFVMLNSHDPPDFPPSDARTDDVFALADRQPAVLATRSTSERSSMKNTLAVILAGGKGTRLEPLTRDRAKPAVPFGGLYRIIDFTLSNCLNSDIRRLLMLTQYKAMSLDRHINQGWRHYFNRELGEFIDVVPPQQRIDEQWYQGTADAVYQNIYVLEKERPEHVVILAGDHIYKMNYKAMV